MKRVLLVDDNEDMLPVVLDALRKPDYEVDFCSEPFQALKKLESSTYDLLLCDIKMPTVSGLMLVEELRKTNQGIHVLFITGESSEETSREALRLRTAGVLEKPFRLTELRQRIRAILGNT